jgi:hypothetical protein
MSRHRFTSAHLIGLIALFVALGGVSYAAATLPANSVGSKQLRTAAVTHHKLARNAVTSAKVRDASLLASDFKPGQLPAGPKGAKGDSGPQGPPGPQGVPGPTAGAQSGGDDPPSTITGPHTGTLSTTTLTTPAAGSVFAFGHVNVNVSCPADSGFNCNFELGLYIDGQPVPGGGRFLLVPNNTVPTEIVELFGVATGVPAGTHRITIAYNGNSPNPASVTVTRSEDHSGAIALGG